MTIKILRWMGGSAGDMVLKLLLDSNVNLKSQVHYRELDFAGKTRLKSQNRVAFPKNQIFKMATSKSFAVDQNLLCQQLEKLDKESHGDRWLLKSHSYLSLAYPVIDIVVTPIVLPFVVKANLTKNKKYMPMYHPMLKKIKNKKILYYFHCFNFALDLLSKQALSKYTILLEDILFGWDSLKISVNELGFELLDKHKSFYNEWMHRNVCYFPSQTYKELVWQKKYDYLTDNRLSIEEKYCLLALNKKKFKIFSS